MDDKKVQEYLETQKIVNEKVEKLLKDDPDDRQWYQNIRKLSHSALLRRAKIMEERHIRKCKRYFQPWDKIQASIKNEIDNTQDEEYKNVLNMLLKVCDISGLSSVKSEMQELDSNTEIIWMLYYFKLAHFTVMNQKKI
jgi:hypothetical protein